MGRQIPDRYQVLADDIRRIIYTTSSIEAVHRQFRKLTKANGGLPNDDSLSKLLFMGIQNVSNEVDYADPELDPDHLAVADLF